MSLRFALFTTTETVRVGLRADETSVVIRSKSEQDKQCREKGKRLYWNRRMVRQGVRGGVGLTKSEHIEVDPASGSRASPVGGPPPVPPPLREGSTSRFAIPGLVWPRALARFGYASSSLAPSSVAHGTGLASLSLYAHQRKHLAGVSHPSAANSSWRSPTTRTRHFTTRNEHDRQRRRGHPTEICPRDFH